MSKELHCFILWEKSRRLENEIIEDIRKHFKIVKIYEVLWDKRFFADNLSRFYGKKLAKSHKKEKQCGNGKFLFIPVIDEHPDLNSDAKNLNVIKAKANYRNMTGCQNGYLVHASDNAKEADENMRFVLGIGADDFCTQNKTILNNVEYTPFTAGMIAQSGWKNKKQLLNFAEKTPNTTVVSAKELVFQTDNVPLLARYLNAKRPPVSFIKGKYFLKIGTKKTVVRILSDTPSAKK